MIMDWLFKGSNYSNEMEKSFGRDGLSLLCTVPNGLNFIYIRLGKSSKSIMVIFTLDVIIIYTRCYNYFHPYSGSMDGKPFFFLATEDR